jgi:hypothetical protein
VQVERPVEGVGSCRERGRQGIHVGILRHELGFVGRRTEQIHERRVEREGLLGGVDRHGTRAQGVALPVQRAAERDGRHVGGAGGEPLEVDGAAQVERLRDERQILHAHVARQRRVGQRRHEILPARDRRPPRRCAPRRLRGFPGAW